MRIGELSARSQVSVATIKYYLREGLLPAGTATAANQATYTEAHLERLRLIRALIEVGGLSVAQARGVLDAVDSPDVPPHSMLGAAHHAVTRTPRRDTANPAWQGARAEVEELVRRRGWQVDPGSPGIDQAADAVRAMRALGQDDLLDSMDTYASAAETVAAKELDLVVARRDPVRMVEGVVTGTVLGEVLLTALRLLAQQDASKRRLAGPP
ncbi:MAG TPA: MerR family transcriptional regulator [Micromonosporaceae bacterium]|nr:MerR family transcriptional regulator [Micromonosporaceae bacterium]